MSNTKSTSNPSPVLIMPFAPWSRGPKPFNREAEKHDPSTRTIPDDSFTIQELFERYKKGQPMPLGIERPISYGDGPTHNDLDLSRIARMDLSEIRDLSKRVSDTAHALRARKEALEAKAIPNAGAPKADDPAPKP